MKHRKMGMGRIGVYIFLILISIIAFIPFYSMIVMGTYYSNDLYTGIKLFPGDYLVENFKTLMKVDMGGFYKNSLFVSITSTVFGTLICASAGYAFAKFKFKGKKVIYTIILLTLMVPTQLSIVAYVMEMRAFGLNNSLWPLIFPYLASPFGVYWMTQYSSDAVPTEILESARIDGSGELRTFVRIVLPLLGPAFVTLGLLIFLWSWNNFLVPSIMVSSPENYTLPLGIRQLGTTFRTDNGAQILGVSLGTIPVLLLFTVFSKNLITGLSSAAVKG